MRSIAHLSIVGLLVGVIGLTGCDSGSDDPPEQVDKSGDTKIGTDGTDTTPTKDRRTSDLVNPPALSDLSDLAQLNAEPQFLEARQIKQKYDDGKPRLDMVIHIYQNGPTLYHGDYKEWHPSGRLWKEGKYDNNRRIGEWKFFTESGRLAKHAYYVDGEPDGQWTFYRDDGSKNRIENWELGIKQGKWSQFGDDGKQTILEQTFRNDLAHGATVRWFPAASAGSEPQKQLETRFVDGRQHGTAKEWHPSGQLKRQIEFRNGKRHGVAKEWDADGRLVLDLQFRDGELVQADN